MKRLLFLLCLLFPLSAFAADVAGYCAVDTDHNGTVDTWCSGISDADNDGQSTATDCDDNNPKMYAGVATTSGCTGGNARVCQSDGTFGACSSGGWCPPECTGGCKYINDAVADTGSAAGSDSADGSFATPWATPQFVTYYNTNNGGASAPGGWDGLDDNECLIYRAGAYTSTYNYNGETHHFMAEGGSGHNSGGGLYAYAGETVEFATNVKYFANVLDWGSFVVQGFWLHHFDVAGGAVINCDGTDGQPHSIFVRNNVIHTIEGLFNDNPAAVRTNECNGTRVLHNDCWDVEDTGQNSHNTVCYLDFRSDDLEYGYNTCTHTTSTSGQVCFKTKHCEDNTTVPNVHHNAIYNGEYVATEWCGSAWLHHNKVHCAGNDCRWAEFGDMGGDTCYLDDTLVEYNTIFNGRLVYILDTDQCAVGEFTHRYNDHVDADSDAIMLDIAGNSTQFAAFITGNKFHTDHNLYDATGSSSLNFNIMASGGGFNSTSLANFKTQNSNAYEQSGVEEAPARNTSGCATSTNGTDKGVCAGAAPTPSPSTGVTYVFTQ